MVVNESETLRWVTVANAEWKRWDFRCQRNVRVSQERTLEGRIFQIAGAAEGKPRAPNEMLQRVTERRLAEADRRVLHGVYHWTRLAWCGGLQVYIGLWFIVAILNLIRSWTGNQCSWLKVARLEVRFRVRTHANVFWVRWRRKIYFCRIIQSLRSPAERWQGQQRQYGSLKSQSNHEYV